MGFLFAGRTPIDPSALLRECLDRRIPYDAWYGLANRFETGNGRGPGRGYLLLTRADLDAIDQTKAQDLIVFDGENPQFTLKKITLLSALCVTPGADGDGGAAYLCEVADRRHFLARVPVDAAFNLRKDDGTGYHAATTNSGTPWTWAQVADRLRAALSLPSMALPFAPHGTPENLDYYGSFAWDALNDLLDRLACSLDYDGTTDTFAVVRLGDADAAAAAAVTSLAPDRVWDGQPVDPARAWRPQKVRVRFVRFPAPTTGASPYYLADVTLAAQTGVESGTYVQLDDDLAALGAAGTPSNSSTLAARATERANDWLRKRGGYERPAQVVYAGHPREPGTAIVGKTYGRAAWEDRGPGLKAEVGAGRDGLLEAWGPRVTGRPPRPAPTSAGSGRGCSFLLDRPANRVFRVVDIEGAGRCGCVDGTLPADDEQPFYLLPDPLPTGIGEGATFYPTRLIPVCDGGCGFLTINFAAETGDGSFSLTATLRVSKACDGTPRVDIPLTYKGCETDSDGDDVFVLTGSGPQLCCGTGVRATDDGCPQGLVIKIKCVPCPDAPDCTSCAPGTAPIALLMDGEAVFSGAYSDYQFKWPLAWLGGCTWGVTCGGVTVTATITSLTTSTVTFSGGSGGGLTYTGTVDTPDPDGHYYPCLGAIGGDLADPPTGAGPSAPTTPLRCTPGCDLGGAIRMPDALVFTRDTAGDEPSSPGDCDCLPNPITFDKTADWTYHASIPGCVGFPEFNYEVTVTLTCDPQVGVLRATISQTQTNGGQSDCTVCTTTAASDPLGMTVLAESLQFGTGLGGSGCKAAGGTLTAVYPMTAARSPTRPAAAPVRPPCKYEGAVVPAGRCTSCGGNAEKAERRHLRRCDLPANRTHLCTREYTAPEDGDNGRWDCSACDYNTNLPDVGSPGTELEFAL